MSADPAVRTNAGPPTRSSTRAAAAAPPRLDGAWLKIAAGLLAVAVVIWAPSLFGGARGDSFGYDLNWSQQFTRQLLSGNLYPRWTAASFDGLGAPTFYFYPPLPFWTVAAIGGLGQAWLSPTLQLQFGELFFLALSGWGMFAWLNVRAGRRLSLIGAALFMLAPYHLDDAYVRAAFAEFAAIAFVPFVGLGLWKAAGPSRYGPLVLAGAWGCLVLCHLPMALLTGLLLALPYGAWLIWQAPGMRGRVAIRLAAGLGLGTGLAAPYVLPALSLQGAISAEYWTSARFALSAHLFAHPQAWTSSLEPFFGFLSLGEASLAAFLGWRAYRRGDGETSFWAALVVLLFVIIAGLAPGFWSLPLLRMVQFPWRAMGLQDFAFVTLFVRSSKADRTPIVVAALAALIGGNLVAVGQFLAAGPVVGPAARAGYGVDTFPTDADAPEYLPQGMLAMTRDGPGLRLPYSTLTRLPLASGPKLQASEDAATGRVLIGLSGTGAGPVTLRRFYFPSWRVRCDGRDVRSWPAATTRLLTFDPPPGARWCAARISPPAVERLADLLALVSLVLAMVAAIQPRPQRTSVAR